MHDATVATTLKTSPRIGDVGAARGPLNRPCGYKLKKSLIDTRFLHHMKSDEVTREVRPTRRSYKKGAPQGLRVELFDDEIIFVDFCF